jgi:CelD/BcsL family acetyltransferase involved in cellulose biosynthesis
MHISEIRTFEELLKLEPTWNKLVNDCQLSVFSSFEWVSTWWKHFGRNRKLVVLVAKENGQVLGIAPLMYSVYSTFGFKVGVIEFISAPQSDYNDFIISDHHEECVRNFIEYLKHIPEHWSYIKLTNIPETSSNLESCKKLFKKTFPICRSPFMLLPDSYDKFFASLGHNLRHNIRKNQKALSTEFKMEFVDCSTIDNCSFGMQSLFTLHQKRWINKGSSGFLASDALKGFHNDVSLALAKKNQLNLLVLKLSEVPVAVSYGFKDDKKFYFYLQGIDPDEKYFKYAVGNQITAYTAAKCIEHSLSEFDFLTGGEEYKKRWGAKSRINLEVIITKNVLTDLRHETLGFIQRTYADLIESGNGKYLKFFLKYLNMG